jgi:hypothetical protein
MTRHTPGSNRRRAATIVEFAFVGAILFLFLFGIFEYCRYLFVVHVSNNAARDAVRYAVVHTGGGTMPGEPAAVSKADILSVVTTGRYGTHTVGSGMAGMEKNIDGYAVDVFTVDPAGLAETPPVIRPMPGSPAPDWNAASFSQKIAVRITGKYRPVLPSLLLMDAEIPFEVTVMYASEAN